MIDFDLTEIKELFVTETIVKNSHIFRYRLGITLGFLELAPSLLYSPCSNLLPDLFEDFLLLRLRCFLLCLLRLLLLPVLRLFLFAPFIFCLLVDIDCFHGAISVLLIGEIDSKEPIFYDETQQKLKMLPVLDQRMVDGLDERLLCMFRVKHKHAERIRSLQRKAAFTLLLAFWDLAIQE